MKKRQKILWGLFAFSPWLLFLAIVPFILPILAKMHATSGTTEMNSIDFAYVVIGSLYVLFVLICFLKYLNGLNTFDKEKKWVWRGFIFFGNVFSIPIFWYYYIWKERN